LLEPAGADSRVVVDLQSCVTELDAPDGKFIVPTTQPSQPSDAIDRTNEVDQELRTTVRLPLGVKVVVGGMTLEPATKDQPSKQLYLVIQADAVK
jgi:hypothetical protein